MQALVRPSKEQLNHIEDFLTDLYIELNEKTSVAVREPEPIWDYSSPYEPRWKPTLGPVKSLDTLVGFRLCSTDSMVKITGDGGDGYIVESFFWGKHAPVEFIDEGSLYDNLDMATLIAKFSGSRQAAYHSTDLLSKTERETYSKWMRRVHEDFNTLLLAEAKHYNEEYMAHYLASAIDAVTKLKWELTGMVFRDVDKLDAVVDFLEAGQFYRAFDKFDLLCERVFSPQYREFTTSY